MITKTLKFALAVSLVAFTGVQASASGEHIPAVTEYVNATVKPWLSDPTVIAAVKAQNEKNASLSQGDIDTLDKQWRAGIDGGDTAIIEGVLGNKLSEFLREKQQEAGGTITELFVMDDKGLNVGQSDPTSDYWQGDEAKFQKSYGAGAGAIFVDEIEKDESTQMLQSQASLTVVDESGKAIGAITIGVNLNDL